MFKFTVHVSIGDKIRTEHVFAWNMDSAERKVVEKYEVKRVFFSIMLVERGWTTPLS